MVAYNFIVRQVLQFNFASNNYEGNLITETIGLIGIFDKVVNLADISIIEVSKVISVL